MDLETLRALFSANLDPIKIDIKELKDGQLQIIEIIKMQTRQETEIKNFTSFSENLLSLLIFPEDERKEGGINIIGLEMEKRPP